MTIPNSPANANDISSNLHEKVKLTIKTDKATRFRYTRLCEEEKTNNEHLLPKLLDCYEIRRGSDSEYKHLQEAVTKMQTTVTAFIKVAIESYISKIMASSDNRDKPRGDVGAYQFLRDMIAENNNTGDHCYINAYTFNVFIRKVSGNRHVLNAKVISRCLQLHNDMISKYHETHNLDVNSNREKARQSQLKKPN